MKTVFADTFYWVSLANPKDEWHQRVKDLTKMLAPLRLVTTEEVLVEVLTFFSAYDSQMRQRISRLVRSIMNNSNIQVIQQTHESFMSGFDLYERRFDKEYSLTDCISMQTMRQLGLTEVLTHDQHFTQEGFTILFKN